MADLPHLDTDQAIRFKAPITKLARTKAIVRFIAAAMFWIWQIAFLVLSLFALLPYFLPEIWVSYRYYDMPLFYFLLTVLLLLLPMFCLGAIVWLRTGDNDNRHNLTLKFFYGFELPSLFLLMVYMLNMRDYGAGMYWVLVTVGIAVCTWCAFVFYERLNGTSDQILFANNPVATVGSTVMFAVGMFVSLALLLFVVPLLVILSINIVKLFLSIDWSLISLGSFWEALASVDWSKLFSTLFNPWALVWMIAFIAGITLFFSSSALVFVLPFVLIYLYIGQFIARFRSSPSVMTAIVAAVVLAILVGVHFNANQQPQQAAFALLDNQPQSDIEKQNLVDQSENIREGILNAYLARYRYFSSTGSASILTDNYKRAFALDDELASYPQQLLNFLLTPILYDGDNRTEPKRAAELYEQFFDAPIQKAELDEIWRTLRHNNQQSVQNAAGLLDVSQESVYIASRAVNVSVEQALATIRVTQKLTNKITRRREAVMHFSLPEYSVVTGVWLSNNENELKKHAPLVAPRGAAQMVYNQEVSRRIDPALLEKVGPELYRLRVYPILGATRTYKDSPDLTPEIIDGEPMYVTFEYQTLANKHAAWPIPALLEKRHLFWDEETVTTINGKAIVPGNNEDWIPEEAGFPSAVSQSPVQLPVNADTSVWAIPSSFFQKDASDGISNLSNTVVLIDGSRSMSAHAPEVNLAVAQMGDSSIYFCQESCINTSISNASSHVYYGNSKPIQQIESFLSGASDERVDRIIVLTDDGSYEAESDKQAALLSRAPIWVVHVGGSQPYAYSDAWLTTVNQSGGGFTTANVSELLWQLSQLNRTDKVDLNVEHQIQLSDFRLSRIDSDWLWFTGASSTADAHNGTYEKLGAAVNITAAKKSGRALQLEQLDDLHLQAIKAQIVTELSSMIVLVNDEQKTALEEASKADDRFDRENEDGTQLVGVPGDSLSVAAVPEPHEWALLMIVLLFASISLYQRRQAT